MFQTYHHSLYKIKNLQKSGGSFGKFKERRYLYSTLIIKGLSSSQVEKMIPSYGGLLGNTDKTQYLCIVESSTLTYCFT